MSVAKRIGLVVGALALLLAGLAVYLVATFDAERVKAELVQAVLARTGRTVHLDGALSLSLFPSVAVAVTDLRVSEREQPAQNFITLKRARVAVRVLPLLSQRIEVEHVELIGLQVDLKRDANGVLNIDDLRGPPAGDGTSETETSAKHLPAFDIAGVEVRGGQLRFADAAGQSLALTDLALATGHLANDSTGALSLSGKLARGTATAVDLQFNAQYQLALGQRQFWLRGLTGAVSGRAPGVRTLSTQLTADELHTDSSAVKVNGLQIKLATTMAARQLNAALSLPALSLTTGESRLTVGRYQLQFDLDDPALPIRPIKLMASGELIAGPKEAAGETVLKVDNSTLKAVWSVNAYAPLNAIVNLDLDQLDADRYLPSAGASAAAGASTPAAAEAPIDLDFLRGLDLRGEFTAGQLQIRKIRASEVHGEFWLHNGRLDLPTIRAALYEGRMAGRASVDAHRNQIALTQSLAGVNVHSLLRDLAGQDVLEGRGDVRLDVATDGETVGALKRRLSGTASVALRDGAIRGINLAKSLRDLKAKFGAREASTQSASAAERTDFSALSASFRIKDGIAVNDDLDGRSPLLRLAGAGQIDVGRSTIDYLAKATVVNTATGQDGKDLAQLRGVTLPVRLSGPFDALSYRIDFAALAGDAVKAQVRHKVEEQIKGRVGDRLGGGLKGLFGR